MTHPPATVPPDADPADETTDRIRRTIDGIWAIESAKVIARVARMVGDVGIAEDLAQDALVAALERWPVSGVPDNPGAWLTATAKNKAVDLLRRRERLDRKQQQVGPRDDGDDACGRPSRTRRPSTTTSATTCSGSCSSPATRCCPATPGWR